jgi:hypothetical protein
MGSASFGFRSVILSTLDEISEDMGKPSSTKEKIHEPPRLLLPWGGSAFRMQAGYQGDCTIVMPQSTYHGHTTFIV